MDKYRVRVIGIRNEAHRVVSIRLISAELERALPPAASGAHIDLILTDNLRRSYSLYRPSVDGIYDIAVQLESGGRGGSRYIHDNVKVGDKLTIGEPKNNFHVRTGANSNVLVAGGIGITPIYAILQSLLEQGREVRLLYCARTAEHAAFFAELSALKLNGVPVDFVFEDVSGRPDLLHWLRVYGHDANYYCCGPTGMLDAFEKACSELNYKNCFVERFASTPSAVMRTNSYQVQLVRSGNLLTVGPGVSLLDALLESGIDISWSCREGVCGSCETSVISGDIDHRDKLLSDEEKGAGNTMFVCVSGCRSQKLVLDL
jgi:ferredoxin-NADP reductase